MACLVFITTGGTFDKEYGRGAGVRSLSFGPASAVLVTFSRVLIPSDWQFQSSLAKDSLELTDKDRATIAVACETAPCDAVVIMYRTDKIIGTTHVVVRRELQKTIVLTGAAQPARMKDSDADFNFGFAAAVALSQPHGVYVAMNGNVFAWNACRKNPATGVFQPI